jgi:hypothetical protein
MPVYNHATNAPLTLHPEILEEVLRYFFLPKNMIEATRANKNVTERANKALPLSICTA